METQNKMNNLRSQFADTLEKLMNNDISNEEWQRWMVNHYHDVEIENIRREIVRLSIAGTLYSPATFQQLEEWRNALL
jgi:hypothetical protein